jgi:hypothetical protein
MINYAVRYLSSCRQESTGEYSSWCLLLIRLLDNLALAVGQTRGLHSDSFGASSAAEGCY